MKIICQKCKGNGYHKEQFSGEQLWLAPFTFGISLIRDTQKCKVCNGQGYYEDSI